jgi:tetratricopeptide (TPR) repeat protein
MLKNQQCSFDSEEFEEIILHYLDMGKAALAKSLKVSLRSTSKIYRSKIGSGRDVSIRRQTRNCRKLLNELYAIEPNNEEIYIQKPIFVQRDQHEKTVELLKIALQFTDDYADVYNLIGMEYLFMDNFELAKQNFIKCLKRIRRSISFV